MPVTLSERLRDRIRREGPISFADFMEAALHDPEGGYYSRGARIGDGGDFVTSPFVSPAFAATLARRFARDAETQPERLDFVEVGAGSGKFLSDFRDALRVDSPGAAARTRFTAVERSARARESLDALGIRALASAEDLQPRSVVGWIFANELYDALPVSRVVGAAGGGLEELRVDVAEDRFVWTRASASEPLRAHLARLGITLEPGQIGEVSLDAAALHRRLARAIERGRLVVFDYGHRSRVLYHPLARPRGTLAVHAGGRRGGDPLENVGDVDLTAHVDWDDLSAAGESEGLTTAGVFRQGSFLTEEGLFDFAANDSEKWRAYRLVDPEGMGEELSVLVQTRGL